MGSALLALASGVQEYLGMHLAMCLCNPIPVWQCIGRHMGTRGVFLPGMDHWERVSEEEHMGAEDVA